MSWSKPAYTDLRIGFEVTMYFSSRCVLPKRKRSSTPRFPEALYFPR